MIIHWNYSNVPGYLTLDWLLWISLPICDLAPCSAGKLLFFFHRRNRNHRKDVTVLNPAILPFFFPTKVIPALCFGCVYSCLSRNSLLCIISPEFSTCRSLLILFNFNVSIFLLLFKKAPLYSHPSVLIHGPTYWQTHIYVFIFFVCALYLFSNLQESEVHTILFPVRESRP